MNEPKHTIILGAGLAGLSAAYDLGKAGKRVTLLECAPEAGGLASSFFMEGHAIERFYHFICRGDHHLMQLSQELGITHKLNWHHTHTSNFYNGHLYSFSTPFDLMRFSPIPFWQRIRFGLHILQSRFQNSWQSLDGVAAAPWLISHLGEEAYNVIWKPLLQVKFGAYYEHISAAWMWHRIWRVARSRQSLLAGESFGYFEDGSHTLTQALRLALQAMPNVTLQFNTRVNSIELAGEEVKSVESDRGSHTCTSVISTLALEQLVRLLPRLSNPYFEKLHQIQMIGVVCMVMSLRKQLSKNFWLNINDPRIPHNGIIELTNLNQHLQQHGLNFIYIPYYCSTNTPRFHYSDQQLFDENIETLKLVNPSFEADWIKEWHVFRSPYAQAICTTGFLQKIPATRSPIKGLYLSDSTQFYPEDRTLSAAIRLGRQAASQLTEDFSGA